MVEIVWNDWSFLGLMDQRFHINAAGLKSIDDRNGIPFFQADVDQKIYCITVDPDTILQYMIVVFDPHTISGHDLHNPAPFCKIPQICHLWSSYTPMYMGIFHMCEHHLTHTDVSS